MKLTNVKRNTTQSVLIYGSPKTGKTALAGDLAKQFDLIWIDMENGSTTLDRLPEEAKDRIELITLRDTRSYPVAIETCLKIIKGGPVSICEEHGKVSCPTCTAQKKDVTSIHLDALPSSTIVVFDSLTQLTNSAIAHITKGKPDDYKLDYSDWGNLGKLMDIFLSHVQQAKCSIVCISHETETEMEDGKIKIVPTAGTRNFSRNTAKYFSHIVYAEVSNAKHRFTSTTTAKLNIVVGSRSDAALEKMNEPSLLSIFGNRIRDVPRVDSSDITELSNVQQSGSTVVSVNDPKGHSVDQTPSPTITQVNPNPHKSSIQDALARLKASR